MVGGGSVSMPVYKIIFLLLHNFNYLFIVFIFFLRWVILHFSSPHWYPSLHVTFTDFSLTLSLSLPLLAYWYWTIFYILVLILSIFAACLLVVVIIKHYCVAIDDDDMFTVWGARKNEEAENFSHLLENDEEKIYFFMCLRNLVIKYLFLRK